jgi:Cys-tRNA(Pro) deacylase
VTPPADDAPPHLVAFLAAHGIAAKFISPGVPMPTVVSAAAAIGVPEDQILKTLLFVDDAGAYVIAIASGSKRVDRQRLAAVSGLVRPRAARPEEVFAVTGFQAGGVAPLGLASEVPVIVDANVADLEVAFGGGGHEHLLLEVVPADVIRLNNAVVSSIVE